MTTEAAANAPVRSPWRSTGAILAGFVTVFVLSLGTDQVLHVLGVYPPWGEPMWDPGLNLLALAYRCVYTVLGCYLAARLAPHSPMRHVWILGGIGFVLATIGALGAMSMKLGPNWYPIMLAATTLPCTWLGGWLYVRQAGRSSPIPAAT